MTKGTEQHQEAHLFSAAIQHTVDIDADELWLENVMGGHHQRVQGEPGFPSATHGGKGRRSGTVVPCLRVLLGRKTLRHHDSQEDLRPLSA